MYIEPKEVKLKDGRILTLRSAGPEDAKAMLEHTKITAEETYFLTRYPEEITKTKEQQADVLNGFLNDEEGFTLAAFDGEKLVANIGVQKYGLHIKYRHRAAFWIALQEKYCSLGLGTLMMQEALENVRKTTLEQLELGVFEENTRAIGLYEKMGFIRWGRQPKVFKLKDGSYRDEIHMICYL